VRTVRTDKFLNPSKHPSDADLRKRIGPSYQQIEDTINGLQSEFEGITFEWMFSKTSGWHLVCNRRKRRLFYLIPSDGDFRFRMVFGDKALAEIMANSFPKLIVDMIRSAKKYPEGTLCELTKDTFTSQTAFELLKIKIAN
jgi:hypothetical protein